MNYSTPSLQFLSFDPHAVEPDAQDYDLELKKQTLGAIQAAFDRSGMSGDKLARAKIELLEISANGTIPNLVYRSLTILIESGSAADQKAE